jgi:hypothetical protein
MNFRKKISVYGEFWILCALNCILVYIFFPTWFYLVLLTLEGYTLFTLIKLSHHSLINEMRQAIELPRESKTFIDRRLFPRTVINDGNTDNVIEMLCNFGETTRAKIVNYGEGGMRLRIPKSIIDRVLYIESKYFSGIASVCWSRQVNENNFEVGLAYRQ